ncbi:MAG TPA: hypothetical protein VIX73_00375 [Kofleriaceae bacterium]|jgi:hypothetical protein
MLAAGSSRATGETTDRSRRERSQPALRLPGSDRIESRAVGRLAALIDEVIVGLERPGDEPFHAVVARCNAALEACLEDEREREPPVVTARAELERLSRQLTADDGTELTQIMRQIRCVLGRLDTHRRD